MAVSKDFLAYVIEQLSGLPQVATRRMFGAVGIYSRDLFFAIIDADVVYFKVDDTNRGDFIARGSKPFCPFPDKPLSMNYYDIGADILEDAEQLSAWAKRSVTVAGNSVQAKRSRLKTKTKTKTKSSRPRSTVIKKPAKVESSRRPSKPKSKLGKR